MTTQDKRQPSFTDTDRMLFGKYKGECLQDVPASYLEWLWGDGLHEFSRNWENSPPASIQQKTMLSNYIWNSKAAIEQELGHTF